MVVVVLQLRHELVHLGLPSQVGQLRVEVGEDRGGQEGSLLQFVQLQLVENVLDNVNLTAEEGDIDQFPAHLFFRKLTPSEAAGQIVLSEEGGIARQNGLGGIC